jgi:ADP-ribosyl-[dinitrogen reductase] hydrolase
VVYSLEAALWAFEQTTIYKDALLFAVNLGGDADTIAAITVQIAGAYYGLSQILDEWLRDIQ